MQHRKEKLLETFLRQKEKAKFKYGSQDCCTFVIQWVKRVTKNVIAEDMVYKDEKTAIALIKKHGDLYKLAHEVLGKSKPVLLTKPGDIICMKINNEWTMGISAGVTGAFISKTGGILRLRLNRETRSWNVGD